MLIEEVVSRGMRCSARRKALVCLELDSMNEIREVRSIVDEERRQVVANKILIAALGVDLRRKAMRIAAALATTRTRYNNGEAGEDLANSTLLQPACRGEVAPVPS